MTSIGQILNFELYIIKDKEGEENARYADLVLKLHEAEPQGKPEIGDEESDRALHSFSRYRLSGVVAENS